MPTHTFIIYNSISQTEGLALGVDKMKKTKKAVSLILAFAMVLSAMLGCMTVSSFATEGQTKKGPKLVDYSIDIANDTKTEAGAEFKINLKFDQQIKIVEKWILSAFNITLNGGSSLDSMGFELKSGEVSNDKKTVILDVKAKENAQKPRLVSGELDVALKSNYYDAITDATGELPVSEWTDINTYVPTGLGFEKVEPASSTAQNNSVTFKMTGPAMLRGMSSIQILVDGESITKDPSGLVPIHTHTYLANGEFVPVSTWVKALCEKFQSDDYTITQGTEDDVDQFTIAAKANESDINLADSTEVHMFGYTEPDDKVVQTALLKEEIAAAQKRLDEIGEDSDKVSPNAKAALKKEIEEAEKNLENIPQGTTALGFMKMRVGLQKAVEGARDNAITSTKAERYDGMVSLDLNGSQQWSDAITEIKIKDNNGFEKKLETTQYKISPDKLIIDSTAFDKDGDITPRTKTYTIVITANKFAEVTGQVEVTYKGANTFTIRYIDKDGSTKAMYSIEKTDMKQLQKSVEETYNTACSMTGLRTFKAKGVYIEDLIDELKLEEKGIVLNPDALTVKLRTNDSLEDENDSATENGYYSRSQTTYNNLMQPRYSFPNLYSLDSGLGATALQEGYVSDALRAALGADTGKKAVKPMIAYEYVETVYNSNQDSPESMDYDPNLSADKAFRFLFGTAMTEENGKTMASKETTTWMASYQVFGLDIVDESVNVSFDTTPEDAEVVLKDSTGKVMSANEDGSYTVAPSSSYKYTYTISADGYHSETETAAFTKDDKIEVSLSRESSGGGGGGSAVAKDYTVTFDSNGGSDVAKQTVTSGEKVNKPADPIREGYEFAGWYTDSKLTTAYDFSSKVTKSITLYAKWTEKGAEPEPSTSFKDVAADAWYAEYVSYLAGKGIVNGKTADTFAPDAQITRAEFIKIIAGVAGADVSGKSSSRFSDVASDAWYVPYVAWGVENGIINGTSETTFHPNGNISRQDMATMIKRYTDFAKFTLPTDAAAVNFTDSAQISSYAADAVKAMQQAGIINGKGGNTFVPKDNATRAEACKMLTVLMKMMEA